MSRVAILLSGQGGQHRGMFDLLADAPAATAAFAAAAAVLGRDPREVVAEAEAAALFGNRLGQVLVCTRALAAWAALRLDRGEAVLAGYSVGELAAWGCAGVFDPPTLLRLAAARAEAMDAATGGVPSGLSAIRGLPRAALDAICRAHGTHVAIVNGVDRFILGGRVPALDAAERAALAEGAERVTRLDVAVPSHTPLLRDAAAGFAETLRAAPRAGGLRGGLRLLSGIDGTAAFEPEPGLDKLARQVAQPVEWAACLEACAAAGVDTVLELGPGTGLAGMARDALPRARVHGLDDFRTLAGAAAWLDR